MYVKLLEFSSSTHFQTLIKKKAGKLRDHSKIARGNGLEKSGGQENGRFGPLNKASVAAAKGGMAMPLDNLFHAGGRNPPAGIHRQEAYGMG